MCNCNYRQPNLTTVFANHTSSVEYLERYLVTKTIKPFDLFKLSLPETSSTYDRRRNDSVSAQLICLHSEAA